MKKIYLLFLIGLLLISPLLSAQNNETTNNKLSYSIFNEYGFYFSPISIPLNSSSYGSIMSGFTTTMVNNITLNGSQNFGLGLGFEYDSEGGMNVPIFFNFRNYFGNSDSKFRPMINAAIGMRICSGEYRIEDYYWDDYSGMYIYYNYYAKKTKLGAYATFGGGFKAGSFSFHAAYFLRTGVSMLSMGLEMKVGFVF